ncbi:MAG: Slp family lipoprotein [Methylomonas sp.]
MKTFVLLITVFFLAGCASTIPQNIRQAPIPDLSISAVIAQGSAWNHHPVRWGGSILTVANHASETEIEILAKTLDSSGKVVDSDDTQGRFLVRVDGFVDPAVYAKGRLVTVYGLVDAVITRNIGQTPYVYPVIKAQTVYLWPKEPEYIYRDYYDPYGYYYGPYGMYPYGYWYGGFGRRW